LIASVRPLFKTPVPQKKKKKKKRLVGGNYGFTMMGAVCPEKHHRSCVWMCRTAPAEALWAAFVPDWLVFLFLNN
jgi:hypothetical protein